MELLAVYSGDYYIFEAERTTIVLSLKLEFHCPSWEGGQANSCNFDFHTSQLSFKSIMSFLHTIDLHIGEL